MCGVACVFHYFSGDLAVFLLKKVQEYLRELSGAMQGELYYDRLLRTLYATDGSIYRELPLAVAYPRNAADISLLLAFARRHNIALTPRTAGTSLAGQAIGPGIIVDVSRHFNKILEVNAEEGWVRLQPGVIRDELNQFVKPFGWFFGPNTSTANRCMIGGMVGNNSSGTTSVKYGVTRDHVLELRTLLSDGSEVLFAPVTAEEFHGKRRLDNLEGQLYEHIYQALNDPAAQAEIREQYPNPAIHRRNTGYAIDLLLNSEVFTPGGPAFNFCRLLTGSEGTLAFTTEIKLKLSPLPPPAEVLLCAHFSSLDEALRATLIAMQHQPYACELMDKFIMDCTRENREQQKNRFFLEGDPAAVLIIELRGNTREEAQACAYAVVSDLQAESMGYAYPLVYPPHTQRVYALRAAGFGVLSNVKTDAKPIEFVEDTAVHLPDLPAYIAEFQQIMAGFGQQAVYYAHAGAGELHIRPSVNLKTKEGVRQLRAIAEASARLVKKYNGSLSGEHGDGRVRGEFIPLMLGQKNYDLLRQIKHTWDPQGILNPGKIVDAPPMDESLRYLQDQPMQAIETLIDFSAAGGILRLAEKCSGSGDCRKLAHVSGGTMCPSYMATRNEKDSTRARANTLRELLTRTQNGDNKFAHKELYDVMDLCLSCKGCSSECPSNVDMAALKAETLYQYYRTHGVPLRSRVFGHIGRLNALASVLPALSNFVLGNALTGALIKKTLGIASQRSLPPLSKTPLRKWQHPQNLPEKPHRGSVFFFCDEFTNYNDASIGQKAIELLLRLGYKVQMPQHAHSGRALISKGLLPAARQLAEQNVKVFATLVSSSTPLLGVEPSAILSFRDEYPRLVGPELRDAARQLAPHCLTIEDFIAREAAAGRITAADFDSTERFILLHGHCHQKALSGTDATIATLSLPAGHHVELIPSGCCGMAGSFGYEKEHYELSMQVGELVLLPAVRKAPESAVIVAPGTSCRHQIADGAGRKALHPVEILYAALR